MTILDTAQIVSDYAEVFARRAEAVSIKRYSGTPGSRTSATTAGLARVTDFAAHELIGPIVQGDRRVVLLANAAITAILPITTADKIVVRGRECAIKSVDNNTRRSGATLIALELVASA